MMPLWGWLLVWLALVVGFVWGHASGRGMERSKGRRVW